MLQRLHVSKVAETWSDYPLYFKLLQTLRWIFLWLLWLLANTANHSTESLLIRPTVNKNNSSQNDEIVVVLKPAEFQAKRQRLMF